jgi:hypothetical protein
MNGLSTQPKLTVEFKGHLIDSLTLSKIADQIQQLGGRYELNDIHIGMLRQDVSSVNMTVLADNTQKLDELLETIKPYGAVPAGQANAELVPCTQDGLLPDGAFTVKLPSRVFYNGQWIDLNGGHALAVVIAPEQKSATLKKVTELRQGDRLVSGTHGVEW